MAHDEHRGTEYLQMKYRIPTDDEHTTETIHSDDKRTEAQNTYI